MSIVIRGMKMPKACINCDVYIAHDYCDHFAQFGTGARKDGRYDDCPLIEIPTPHGRLIDADELRMECYHTMDELMKLTTMDMSAEALSLLCGFTMIGEAPTILEAEGGKEK